MNPRLGLKKRTMLIVKKLDRYILQKFLPIFVGAFFICLFVFMMQFTWRYVDELIGKGLSMDILAQFFWYMGLTLVPQALPLAILLASLITFGNMGENFELLAMKAAGVSLARVMRPIGLVALLMTGISFYFQNSTSPDAQISLRTLLISMKQQSPAVEIPEGVFYNGVPNINIYVEHKNAQTGMLYQTIIYKTDQGFDRAQIVLADSARLEMTADKMHLKLALWSGEQFESLQGTQSTGMQQTGAETPYDRETFAYKQLLIDFDSNFNLMDKNMLADMPSAKNMHQITHSVDSMETEQDSLGRSIYREISLRYPELRNVSRKDSTLAQQALAKKGHLAQLFDTIMAHASAEELQQAQSSARQTVSSIKADLEWRKMSTEQNNSLILRHWVEWHQKMTLSLACLVFFFVGAPLGAIIRKGGLGLPTVISVIIFIIWYIINTSGMKMARDGNLNMFLGMWVSLLVITPFGIFITYKANKDSVVFNLESYLNFLRRLAGIRTKRHIAMKEVIIEDPRLEIIPGQLEALSQLCQDYQAGHRLIHAPGYVSTFFHYKPDTRVKAINEQMEALIEELSNSRNPKIIALLNDMPVLYTDAHTTPFHSRWMNVTAGIIFPIGGILWIRIWRFRLRLLRDLRTIARTCDRIGRTVLGQQQGQEADIEDTARTQRNAIRRRWVKRALIGAFLLAFLILGLSTGIKEWRRYQRQQKSKATPSSVEAPATTPPTTGGKALTPEKGGLMMPTNKLKE